MDRWRKEPTRLHDEWTSSGKKYRMAKPGACLASSASRRSTVPTYCIPLFMDSISNRSNSSECFSQGVPNRQGDLIMNDALKLWFRRRWPRIVSRNAFIKVDTTVGPFLNNRIVALRHSVSRGKKMRRELSSPPFLVHSGLEQEATNDK